MGTIIFRKLPVSIFRAVQAELDFYDYPDDGGRKLLCSVSP
jgi:hypothetical protein